MDIAAERARGTSTRLNASAASMDVAPAAWAVTTKRIAREARVMERAARPAVIMLRHVELLPLPTWRKHTKARTAPTTIVPPRVVAMILYPTLSMNVGLP